MIQHVHRGLWLAAGLLLTILGMIGILMPVMPGILFFAMAVPAFMRCSDRFNRWLRKQSLFIRLHAWHQRRKR